MALRQTLGPRDFQGPRTRLEGDTGTHQPRHFGQRARGQEHGPWAQVWPHQSLQRTEGVPYSLEPISSSGHGQALGHTCPVTQLRLR